MFQRGLLRLHSLLDAFGEWSTCTARLLPARDSTMPELDILEEIASAQAIVRSALGAVVVRHSTYLNQLKIAY